MSKLGKKIISVPKDSKVAIQGNSVTVTGPKGTEKILFNEKVFSSKVNDKNEFMISPLKKDKSSSAMWGTYRSLINNAIFGVTKGHEKNLELSGVGFKVAQQGDELKLKLGFSHEAIYKVPKGINIKIEKQTKINIAGTDKSLVSKVASEIKSLKPVEPYKAKGIKEKDQYIIRKEGKKK
jgi:large subunit ribosomal protein L6|tara:strand:+ start:24 stop:563 length:540 start_codon:yes stop_codon:yes gene_type:complete